MDQAVDQTSLWRPWERGISARPFLPVTLLELTVRFEEYAKIPGFRGALWRSVLGPQLKALDTQGGWRPDMPSPLPPSLYDWFFAPSRKHTMLAPEFGEPLSPIVLDAPPLDDDVLHRPGATTRFRVVLAGRAGHAAQAIAMAFARAARCGLGDVVALDGRRGRATLIRADVAGKTVYLDQKGWLKAPVPPQILEPPACPSRLRVVLRTPFRLEPGQRVLEADEFVAADLLSALIRRVSSLMRSEAGVVLETDFQRLSYLARTARWQPEQLHNVDLSRWSSRQGRRFPASGISGSFLLDLSGREELFDFLWLGLFVHAGKGTMAGLGGLALEAL